MKLLNYIIIVVFCTFCITDFCFARDSSMGYTIFIPGGIACSQITADTEEVEGADFTYHMYLNGFMTAYNLMREGKANYFGKIDDQSPLNMLQSSYMDFIKSYCKDNPQAPLIEAINMLILKYNDSIW